MDVSYFFLLLYEPWGLYTLLLVCEEGEIEYDPELLKQTNTELVVIDSEEDFTTSTLSGIERRVKPDRIIIEWNGMWNYDAF